MAGQGGPPGVRAGPAHSGLDFCARTSPGRDTFIVTLGNAITSILAGFAIFSVLGYMSQELGVPVDQVAKAGGQAGQPWWVRGWGGGGAPQGLGQGAQLGPARSRMGLSSACVGLRAHERVCLCRSLGVRVQRGCAST